MKSLPLILTSLLFGACVGNVGSGPAVQPKADAPEQQQPDAFIPPPDAGPAAGCVERSAQIATQYIHKGGGGAVGPETGGQCLNTGCHNIQSQGTGAQAFLFAGTIYKLGTSDPDPGATIVITPDNPAIQPLTVTANDAGNFYVVADGYQKTGDVFAPITALPASAMATVCPTLVKGHQSIKIGADTGSPKKNGNCNACHAQPADGGSQTPINAGTETL